jgi:hypothetical protein
VSTQRDTPAAGRGQGTPSRPADPYQHRNGDYVPIQDITDWRPGGPADRLYDNEDQFRADILSLLDADAEEKEPGPELS